MSNDWNVYANNHNTIVPEAAHFDEGKVALQFILAFNGLDQVAQVGEFGAQKYGQWNYKSGMPWMKLLGSCTRHLAAFIRGEDTDKESGFSHLAHLVYDALMIMQYQHEKTGKDDRYKEVLK